MSWISARAAQRRAQADYRDAHLAYTRLVAVNKEHPNLIAQQDLDTAEAQGRHRRRALWRRPRRTSTSTRRW